MSGGCSRLREEIERIPSVRGKCLVVSARGRQDIYDRVRAPRGRHRGHRRHDWRADGAARGDEGGRQRPPSRAPRSAVSEFHPNDCASGAGSVPSFLGANLRAQRGLWAARRRQRRQRAAVGVLAGWQAGRADDRQAQLSAWDVAVGGAHQTVNRVNVVNGHVRVSARSGGGTVKANVTFERCAQ